MGRAQDTPGQINLRYTEQQVAGREGCAHAGCPGSSRGVEGTGREKLGVSQPVWGGVPREFWVEESKKQFIDMLNTEAFLGGVHRC